MTKGPNNLVIVSLMGLPAYQPSELSFKGSTNSEDICHEGPTHWMAQPEGSTNLGNTCIHQKSQIKISRYNNNDKMRKIAQNLKYVNSRNYIIS